MEIKTLIKVNEAKYQKQKEQFLHPRYFYNKIFDDLPQFCFTLIKNLLPK